MFAAGPMTCTVQAVNTGSVELRNVVIAAAGGTSCTIAGPLSPSRAAENLNAGQCTLTRAIDQAALDLYETGSTNKVEVTINAVATVAVTGVSAPTITAVTETKDLALVRALTVPGIVSPAAPTTLVNGE